MRGRSNSRGKRRRMLVVLSWMTRRCRRQCRKRARRKKRKTKRRSARDASASVRDEREASQPSSRQASPGVSVRKRTVRTRTALRRRLVRRCVSLRLSPLMKIARLKPTRKQARSSAGAMSAVRCVTMLETEAESTSDSDRNPVFRSTSRNTMKHSRGERQS